jgi:hypothetical protein
VSGNLPRQRPITQLSNFACFRRLAAGLYWRWRNLFREVKVQSDSGNDSKASISLTVGSSFVKKLRHEAQPIGRIARIALREVTALGREVMHLDAVAGHRPLARRTVADGDVIGFVGIVVGDDGRHGADDCARRRLVQLLCLAPRVLGLPVTSLRSSFEEL